ncbi:MAG TPA: fumarylacetoacetate hydrolase family protein [Casimicrobiaceae bacterium]|nr:fumarylacetoacetate hydrolase family protein [Casimicrobiaceae bacterium]
MTQPTWLFDPPPTHSLPVRGSAARYPINRLFFVGRNYHAHAAEMGRPVDKATSKLFYFTKSPSTLVESGATVPYPPETKDYQFEMELVLAIGATGFRVSESDAHKLILGYACGLDMTRRDLQLAAREQGRPWDLGKDLEHSSVVSEIVRMPGTVIDKGALTLSVNGTTRQQSDVSRLIWNVREILADLSKFYHLQPGDLIFTGTPEGVGPVVAGDKLEGRVEGVGSISLTVGPAELS